MTAATQTSHFSARYYEHNVHFLRDALKLIHNKPLGFTQKLLFGRKKARPPTLALVVMVEECFRLADDLSPILVRTAVIATI
jgi:hypothetical protein